MNHTELRDAVTQSRIMKAKAHDFITALKEVAQEKFADVLTVHGSSEDGSSLSFLGLSINVYAFTRFGKAETVIRASVQSDSLDMALIDGHGKMNLGGLSYSDFKQGADALLLVLFDRIKAAGYFV